MIEKAYLSDNRVTHVSKSFTHKMAAKTSWHRYGTKLSPYVFASFPFLFRHFASISLTAFDGQRRKHE